MLNLLEGIAIQTKKEGAELCSIFWVEHDEDGFGVQAYVEEMVVFSLGFGDSESASNLSFAIYQSLLNCFKQTLNEVFNHVGLRNPKRLVEEFYQLLTQRVDLNLFDADFLNANKEEAARIFTGVLDTWLNLEPDDLPSVFEEVDIDLDEEGGLELDDLEGDFLKETSIQTFFDQELCSILLYEDEAEDLYSVILESEGELLSTLSFDHNEGGFKVAEHLYQAAVNCAQETCHDVYKVADDEPNGELEACFWALLKNRMKDKLNSECDACEEQPHCEDSVNRLNQFINQWSSPNVRILPNYHANHHC